MRIAIVSVGSRGETQPAIALGSALAARGHEIVLGLSDDLADFGTQAGLTTVAVGLRVKDFLGSADGRRWLASGDAKNFTRGLFKYRMAVGETLQRGVEEATDGADLIVSARTTQEETLCMAEQKDIPLVGLHFSPTRKNDAFPSFLVTTRRLPRPLIRRTHDLFDRNEWLATADYVNAYRAKLGLPAVSGPISPRLADRGVREIQAYSRFLVPQLADKYEDRPLTGFLTLSPAQRRSIGEGHVDPALLSWLDDGDPPIYFGFGSMPVLDAEHTLGIIARASRRLGMRALVSAGWSGLGETSADGDRMFVTGAVNHDAVLPRCHVAVHHGGAGTTAAVLGAGIPAVVCSVFSDQPFWGRQLARMGVGRTFPFTELNETNLVRALRPMLRLAPGVRAAGLAAQLAGEHAEQRAADVVEQAARHTAMVTPR
jgi:UDP:flavonoid glycosyltransferase YjiC (YdhE family)